MKWVRIKGMLNRVKGRAKYEWDNVRKERHAVTERQIEQFTRSLRESYDAELKDGKKLQLNATAEASSRDV